MTDYVKLLLRAGDGGKGKVSFRREKYVPKGGPDGGDGGDGGSIILRGNEGLATLQQFAGVTKIEAEHGEVGGKKKKSGKKAESLVLEVPPGTIVWHIAENSVGNMRRLKHGMQQLLARSDVVKKQYIADGAPYDEADAQDTISDNLIDYQKTIQHADKIGEILHHGQELVVCQGGFGGKGNDAFKSATNQVPLVAEFGTPGEQRFVALELRLLADIGFVGLPSVGKSTLLSVLTKARPKVAEYHFTTLEPHLGIMSLQLGDETREVVLADIPGLIEGASEGKGLGFEFLRHIDHCQSLLFIVALDEYVVFDTQLSFQDKAKQAFGQFEQLSRELVAYHASMMDKKIIVGLNKIDIYPPELVAAFREYASSRGVQTVTFSCATLDGIEKLKKVLAGVV